MTFPPIDETHDPALRCWVQSADRHAEFPVQNLPLGIFSPPGASPRTGVAIGEHILDLSAIVHLLPGAVRIAVQQVTLNALLALPATARRDLRHALSTLLCDPGRQATVAPHLNYAADCAMHLPAAIGDYTDFYVGIHHATNIGKLFRPDSPLLPNYKHVPIGYHGRASSVRVSGDPVRRPSGQCKPPKADAPMFAPTARLDYELELGIWIGPGNALGDAIPIDQASGHIAGFCLLNDWSARDFQAWEYVPLGPFLAKNFQTTISPWIVSAEAMAPFRMTQPSRPEGDPGPLPYLWDEDDQAGGALNLELEVFLSTERMRGEDLPPHRLSVGAASSMYWTAQQIVTHHASNGCNLNPGDLLGTGTLSAPTREGYGSLVELSEGGRTAVRLPNGEERTFLADGDELTLKATARADGYLPIGFGACTALILPAR